MRTFLEFLNNKEIGKTLTDRYGEYKVFTINPSAIRASSVADDEFNDFGTHLQFNFIPDKEIWLSKDLSTKERQFAVHNSLNQYLAKKKGIKDWYDYALNIEKAERAKVDGLKFVGREYSGKVPDDVYDKFYCFINSPGDHVKVWLVNSEDVQNYFKTDFVLGGNGMVYSFCPKDEIWIDKQLAHDDKDEINYVIIHEYVESTLMKLKKLSYDKAHSIASKVEYHYRQKGFSKKDVESLNRQKALKMAKNYL